MEETTVEAAIKAIEGKHGKGATFLASSKDHISIDAISSGSIALDRAIGVGGFPKGRMSELLGSEMSGKTTICLQTIASSQKEGGLCAFIDSEHALSLEYAKALGVDLDKLYLSQPDCGEQALDILEEFLSSKSFSVVVVDSVAALTPRSEIEGDFGDSQMGSQARMMSQAMRKLVAITEQSNTVVLWTNQWRSKIGGYGNPNVSTGGNALKFYSSVRIDFSSKDQIKKGEEIIGREIQAKIIKNKVAAPFKIADYVIMFGKGVVKEYDVINLALEYGIFKKAGSWYSYGEERIGQGRESVVDFLKENQVICSEVEAKLRDFMLDRKADELKVAVQLDKTRKRKNLAEETPEE